MTDFIHFYGPALALLSLAALVGFVDLWIETRTKNKDKDKERE